MVDEDDESLAELVRTLDLASSGRWHQQTFSSKMCQFGKNSKHVQRRT